MSENRAFGMLVAGNSVNVLQICSIALVLLFIMTQDGITGQESLLPTNSKFQARRLVPVQ